MPKYFYSAKKITGETITGTREAPDERELARILRKENLILVKAVEEKLKRKIEITIPFLGVPLTEKLFFTRNLQIMIGAGVPLPRSLETLALQTKNLKFKRAILEIREDVLKGVSFSDSLTRFPKIFSDLYCSMVKVGEEAGRLEEILKNLTSQMEREHDLRQKVKGAMIYPAIIISAMIGIGILLLIVVVPKLAATFKELNIVLPPTTSFVINFSSWLAGNWYWLLLAIIILTIFFKLISGTKEGKKFLDTIFLKIPIFSSIIKKTSSAYLVRNLGTLIASGVPLIRALEVTAGALDNVHFKAALISAKEKVQKGEKLADALSGYENLYPLNVVQMVAVGEETGETSRILLKLAEFFEDEVAAATKNLASAIEPILLLLIGAVVGFFAISMIQPIYSMLGAL